jgi:hypothetical protein
MMNAAARIPPMSKAVVRSGANWKNLQNVQSSHIAENDITTHITCRDNFNALSSRVGVLWGVASSLDSSGSAMPCRAA